MRIIKRNTFTEERVEQTNAEPVLAHGTRVIAVTSGKGGVGKTSFSVNLAIALARLGQRVIIFDADLGLANVDVLLGLSPRFNLHDHIFTGKAIEDVLCPGPMNIKIISGGSGFLELANLTSKQRSRLVKSLDILEQMADIVIIDTGAGISKDVLAFCAAADEVVLVITPEPTSLTDAYGLIKVMDKFKLHRKINFIINQSRSDSESTDAVYRLKTIVDKYLDVHMQYLGDIHYDQEVSRSIKKQQPFMIVNPDAPAAKAIKRIAATMLKREQSLEQEGGMKGFLNKLSRLFR